MNYTQLYLIVLNYTHFEPIQLYTIVQIYVIIYTICVIYCTNYCIIYLPI